MKKTIFNNNQFYCPQSYFDKKNKYISGYDQLKPFTIRNEGQNYYKIENTCAHRGMIIDQELMGLAPFTCQYHGWSYQSNGELKPNRGVGKQTCIKLRAEKLSQTNGLLHTGHFSESLISQCFDAVGVETLEATPFYCDVLTHNANWKWLVENVIETYHLDFVHKNSFVRQGFVDRNDVLSTRIGPNSVSFLKKNKFGRGFYKHAHLFPNAFVSNTSDFITFVSIVNPRTDTTSDLYWFLFDGKKMKNLPIDVRETVRSEAIDFTRKVLLEDLEMLELQQLGCGGTRETQNITNLEPRIKWFWEALNAQSK